MKEINVGDRVFIEQGWEDEAGHYHDEFASVTSIGVGGKLGLKFERDEINEFLEGAEFTAEHVEKI
jgi:hypothetical protein